MRAALIATTVLLAACQAPVADPPANGLPSEAECGADDLQHLVGMPASAADGVDVPGPVRIFRSGDPVTMDYRPERLNVELDARGRRIDRVFCG